MQSTQLEKLEHRLNILNALRKDAMWRSTKAGADIAELTKRIASVEQEIIDEAGRTQKERDKLLPVLVLARDIEGKTFTATESETPNEEPEADCECDTPTDATAPEEEESAPEQDGTLIASSKQDDLVTCDCIFCRMRNDDRSKH